MINKGKGPYVVKRGHIYLIISLLTLITFLFLFVFRAIDDNRLTSWQWVFLHTNHIKVFVLLVLGILVAFVSSGVPFDEYKPVFFLFLISFATSMVFWGIPEVIVDASRYFTQAKHLELFGIEYFFKQWGREIFAWTDMPLVPFLYGLIFKLFGEKRLYIQMFTTLLFSGTIVCTYFTGKMLWNKETGVYAGLLLLGIPYLFSQVPLMLVDIPTMFFFTLAVATFINALQKGGSKMVVLSSISIFLAFFSKYSTWLMLSVLGVIFLVLYFKESKPFTVIPVAVLSAFLIGGVLLSNLEVFSEQLRLLFTYQRPGLRRWEESFVSIFFFQVHPFITLTALYSLYLSLRKRDNRFLIVAWPLFLVFLLEIKRIRYIIMTFPMLALMASYALQSITERRLRRFFVLSVLAYSLIIGYAGYLPFLQKISTVNLMKAGKFVNALNIERVKVFTLQKSDNSQPPPLNYAISVPILDIFVNKDILYKGDSLYRPPRRIIETSPLRFTWEYKIPEYYKNHYSSEMSTAVLIISDSIDTPLPNYIEQEITEYKHSKLFSITERVFRYKTVVKVFYN
jgi:hypothetical protein